MTEPLYNVPEGVDRRRVSKQFHVADYRGPRDAWGIEISEPSVDWQLVVPINYYASLERRAHFQQWCKEWKHETALQSSPDRICSNKSYLKILTLGKAAVPLILSELQREPAHWFFLLEILTDEDPVSPADAHSFKRVREAWLKWGIEKKLLD